MSKISKYITAITKELQKKADPAYASKMKAYMKGHFDYYGVRGPDNKAIFNSLWKSHKADWIEDFRELITELWKKDEREYQYIAIHLVKKVKKKFVSEDIIWLEEMIQTRSWWDTVDFLAGHGVGQILLHDEELKLQKAEEYINHKNMWMRRTALIFQLFYKDKTDKDLLFALIDSTLGSKEFFINKAAGWALRQYSKTDPSAVRNYIYLQRPKLSNLTIKEGSKYI